MMKHPADHQANASFDGNLKRSVNTRFRLDTKCGLNTSTKRKRVSHTTQLSEWRPGESLAIREEYSLALRASMIGSSAVGGGYSLALRASKIGSSAVGGRYSLALRAGRVGWFLLLFCLVSQDARGQEGAMQFRMIDGSVVTGRLAADPQPARLQIHCDGFAGPIIVPVGGLLEGRRPPGSMPQDSRLPDDRDDASSNGPPFAVFLDDGCVLVGAIDFIADGSLVVRSRHYGSVRVATRRVDKIVRTTEMPRLLFAIHNSRFRIRPELGWRVNAESLTCDQVDVAAVADYELPATFRLRVDVSCAGNPDFELSLGDRSASAAGQGGRVDRRGGSLSRLPSERYVTRVEWFDEDVSVIRSNASVSDSAVFRSTGRSHSLSIDLYIDQRDGRLLAYQQGMLIGRAVVDDPQPVYRSVLTLINRGDAVTVDRLDLFQWDGSEPASRRSSDQFTLLADGTMLDAAAVEFQPGRFRIGDIWQSMADLVEMRFQHGDNGAEQGREVSCELTLEDGSRLRGSLSAGTGGEDDANVLNFRNVSGEITIAVDAERVMRLTGDAAAALPESDSQGRLLLPGTELGGRLVDGRRIGGATTFGWRNNVFENEFGTVGQSKADVRFAGSEDAESVDAGSSDPVAAGFECQWGDTLQATMVELKDGQVRFRSESFGEFSLPASLVTRIRLAESPPLSQAESELLLQLPRRMKESPPTHLLVSRTGDVLRGNLLDVDQSRARIVVRGVTRSIPRETIALIEFLTPRETVEGSIAYVLQTRGGSRLSLSSAFLENETIVGAHSAFGECRVPVSDLRQLSFGDRDAEPSSRPTFVPVKEPRTFE